MLRVFILESLYVSYCLHSSFFSPHSHENDSMFHPSRIETNNTHYHNRKHRDQLVFGVQQQLLSSHPQETQICHLKSACWRSDRAIVGLVLNCAYCLNLCVIWTNGSIHTFFVECWIWTLFYLGMISQPNSSFLLQLNFFHIKNTKHKIFKDGNDIFICDIDSYGKSVVQNSHLVSHKQTHTLNIQDMVVGFPSQGHKQTKNKNLRLVFVCFGFSLLIQQKKNCIQTVCWWSYHGIKETAIPSSLFSHSSIPVFLLLLPINTQQSFCWDWTVTQFFWLSERSKNKKENRFAKKKKPKNKKTKQNYMSFSSVLSLLFCVFGLAWMRLYIAPKSKTNNKFTNHKKTET